MKFLRKSKIEKIILVISDLHLGAGPIVNGRTNYLEDFHFDKELSEFLEYYANCKVTPNVELIINGDFFDLLAVPFVDYYADEYWSEAAALEKLEMILKAHPEVIESLKNFISDKNKTIKYLIGNHDSELLFHSVQNRFLKEFPEEVRERIKIFHREEEYTPVKGVTVKHGHQYELAHNYDPAEAVVITKSGRKYLLPPWGSYYVTQVINKFKKHRDYINAVRPVKHFIIYGLIFDTLLTLRFVFANFYYYGMVRFWLLLAKMRSGGWPSFIDALSSELRLFKDFNHHAQEYLKNDRNTQTLIMGHTHEATFKDYGNGTFFINTGTWTKMVNLDFRKMRQGFELTYAQIRVKDTDDSKTLLDRMDLELLVWKGKKNIPFREYHG